MSSDYTSSEVQQTSGHQQPGQIQPQGQQQHGHSQQEQQHDRPRSLLGALSISLYQSLSFSRSPSFERTRYIASTCTFIAIIYLRTLHCLFFGTGALSCAVLAHCLKHIIRQPRPERTDLAADEDMGSTSSPAPATLTPHTTDTSKTLDSSTDPNLAAGSTTSANCEASRRDSLVDPIPRTSSPTLSLAPTTTLQQEQVNASNEPKIDIGNQRIRRQRRRRIYSRIDYGMPSSHAQLVAFFVCYISLQLVLMEPEGSFGQWFLILLLQLYAWSVVWSRIQLGRHTISQVLVGAAIGAVYGMVWFAIWSWKVEDMIKHWQWMDRYGVIQVRKMWKQLEMDEAVAIGRVGGRIYLGDDQGFPHNAHFVRF